MRPTNWLRLVGGALLIAAMNVESSAGPLPGPLAEQSQQAPRFRIRDVQGHLLDLDELRHKGPILIDFWATWCRPCIESLPELEAWHQKFGPRGLTVIGVSIDGPRNFAKVRPFAKARGLSYPVAIDQDGRLQQLFHVLAVPTAILIDTSGVISRVRVAYRPGENAEFEEHIETLLPAPTEP